MRLGIFLAVLISLVLYTFFKITQLYQGHRWLGLLVSVLIFAVMLGGTFIYRSFPRVFESFWFKTLVWSGSILMGLWATFILVSIPVDLFRGLYFLYQKLNVAHDIDPQKRDLIFRGVYFSVLAVSATLAAAGFRQALNGPKVKKVSAKLKGLPRSLHNFKTAQISDLHIGPTLRKDYVEKVVRLTNETQPDMIVLTGDLADANVSSIAEHLEPLSQLNAKYGKFYVTGNHEYYSGALGLIDKMTELGFVALINENQILKVGDTSLMVAGVTDPAGEGLLGHSPDLSKAIASSEEIDFKILLSHRPGTVDEAEKVGFDFQFSGHTHAGQFFPFSLLIGLAHRYTRGLYHRETIGLYVNPGTGYWGPADRLGITAEISEIVFQV